MSLAGVVLIVLPIAFNVAFGMLAARFDYPDVLRKPDPRGARALPRGRPLARPAVVGVRAHRAGARAARWCSCRARSATPTARCWPWPPSPACSRRSCSSSA